MCGIVGILARDRWDDAGCPIKPMADTISHRGPDNEGQIVDDRVALYHKRLSIIDLEMGRQPMSQDGVTIVFNGEIYNYIELRQELIGLGHRFDTNSDTEVILRLYLENGYDCINKLNGMFAFIIYDRNKQRVLLARDHFGIKPLYYCWTDRQLVIASEIKAILAHPDVTPEPNFKAICDYITFQFVLGQATMFHNVNKLLPGHYMTIDLKTFSTNVVQYWDPSFRIDTFHTEEYFTHTLRQLLEDTINIQLRSDVPVGAYLSGGMDSSIVTLLAASKYNGKIQCFHGAFREGPEFDESRYALEVSKNSESDFHQIYPTENDFIDTLPTLIYHMDEPAAGPGLFPQYMVSKLASEKVKAVLGGQGGDEIFGGYTRFVVAYFEQAIKGAIFETAEEGEHIVSLKSILPNLPYLKQYVPMLRRFWGRDLFERMDWRYFCLIDRSEGSLGLYNDDFCNGYRREEIFQRFQKLFNHPETISYYNKMVHFDMVASLPALLHVEDRVSMAHSLESRVPLLDRRIVELVTSMPPSMKFKGAEMKYILKRSVRDLLPSLILNRKEKMGFPVPLHIWAKNRTGDFFKDILFSKACLERGIFNHDEIRTLIDNEAAFGRRLWGIICLELWFQTFIDKG
ncbi:Asparagine synthetase [glutamine-hydrolyzing] (EC [Olavius algarvensis associated proteobacterium Delta 3]|nr:Asparagine synthetase [glutamine-hydrolyzing] (EC [Olavius algarvensis associated proteobacterium Delta 3]